LTPLHVYVVLTVTGTTTSRMPRSAVALTVWAV
jgi:hypothetical protein